MAGQGHLSTRYHPRVTDRPLPFHRAAAMGAEQLYLSRVVEGGHLAGDGPYTRACHQLLGENLGGAKVLLTTSCTHALEMAAILLDLQPGDEVIVPSFTFVSTANAFALRGARPVFADIRPDTLNLDEGRLSDLITPRTRAIVPMHYGGVACEMDTILRIAAEAGIAVVEDNAHGLFGRYQGRALGTLGCLAAQSFHETKNISGGEGGALVINDLSLAARAEIIREKGTDRSRFLRGESDRYGWLDLGSSYLPSELVAACIFAQLEEQERIQAHRRRVWELYQEGLGAWALARGATLPVVPEGCESSFHIFHLLLPDARQRQDLQTQLAARSIGSASHYPPLHLSVMGRSFGGREGASPVAESVSARILRLPLFNSLELDDVDRVIAAVTAF